MQTKPAKRSVFGLQLFQERFVATPNLAEIKSVIELCGRNDLLQRFAIVGRKPRRVGRHHSGGEAANLSGEGIIRLLAADVFMPDQRRGVEYHDQTKNLFPKVHYLA